ncbi:MAG: sulfur relay protein DsrC [Alphaproteobacteria bacterium]|nr:sulfur relay protein DsrC [Alphaproteobacteria bacterium]
MKQRVEPDQGLIRLSELIIRHPEISAFNELLVVVAMAASDGARFIEYDIKPDYRDTPKRWEGQVERAFSLGARYLGDTP